MKYDKDSIYSTNNKLKITINQSGSKVMVREKGEIEFKERRGFRVFADNECISCTSWDVNEKDTLLDTIKRERYAHLAYKELYYDLLQKLRSIGFIQESEIEEIDDRF